MDHSSETRGSMTTIAATISQDPKHLQDRFLPQNVLDLLLKYSALFIAAAYLSGFAYFASLLGFLHAGRSPGLYPISTAIVLTVGTGYLTLYLLTLSTMLYPICSKTQRWWVWAFIPSLAIVVTTALHLSFDASWSLSGLPFLPLLVSGYMVWWYNRRQTAARYYMAVVYVVLGLIVFSGIFGFLRTRRQHGWHRVRLLVSPDAKAGAKDLGIGFSLPQKAGTEPELSAPITILIEDDKTYLLRMDDGGIVELAKDKVWGAQWSEPERPK